jgi:hypothetical protein
MAILAMDNQPIACGKLFQKQALRLRTQLDKAQLTPYRQLYPEFIRSSSNL